MTASVALERPVALRPLALPAEHGGWGFLAEPVVLGLLVAPSPSGWLIAASAGFAFLARQPLKLLLQDLLRGRTYPRTPYCRALTGVYLLGALLALSCALAIGGTRMVVPLALAAPLAIIQVMFDAANRSRELVAEISGAVAMASVAAAIVLADGMPAIPAYGLAGILIARFVPAILYVRALLGRLPPWCALMAHVVALGVVASYAGPAAIGAMVILLIRAAWGLTHTPPRTKIIGWREVVFGGIHVVLVSFGYRSL